MNQQFGQRVNRWSIRRLSVGVASVVVATGFFVGAPNLVSADEVAPATSQVAAPASGETLVRPEETSPSQPAATSPVSDKVSEMPAPEVSPSETPESSATSSSSDSNKTDVDTVVMPEKVETPAAPAGQNREASPEVTSPEQVQTAVVENVKSDTQVPVAYLDKANFPGPFTAGVNQVIPYEFFGGDGMLTRLLLKASDTAPWSDNGVDKNPLLPPVEGLGRGQYFYQVSLDGPAVGLQDQALLDQLKKTGTHTYTATVNVYGIKDGKADLSNVVATRQVTVNLNGVTTLDQVKKAVEVNVKSDTQVPVVYLDKANFPGPFTAGVNQVIPYEFFGGDGMLTRLLLKASDTAPWSDNGVDKNPLLPPVEGLGRGQYFYQVSLDGPAAGLQDQALLDQLKKTGTHTYTATVNVYGIKDGKADLSNVVATRQVTVNLNGVTTLDQVKKAVEANVKSDTQVPVAYLDKANFPGPFTAGVNQVIPYEFFGGDGMLTRLLLKSSDSAPWSDNGVDKNPLLPPVEGLGRGQYFYQVALDGPAAGLQDQALLDQLKKTGTHTYTATVNVYGIKDGKADLSNVVATRTVKVTLNGYIDVIVPNQPMNQKPGTMMSGDKGGNMKAPMSGHAAPMAMANKTMTPAPASAPAMKGDKMMLPNTGENTSNLGLLGIAGVLLAGTLSLFGLKHGKED